ncbi:MAG: LysR family transcriptional regulator [Xanthobacteraceae bacterium]|jgi:DNA-binding transcriptional LysR family regulator
MDWTDRIGRRIKPRDLHVFLAVAEHGNMAKAAESLAISRPVVSKTIADLEQALGVRLFDRSPHGIEPTLYGRALAKRSVAVFDELRQSVKDIEFLADPTTGELRVGCPEVMAAGFVAAALDRLSAQYPKLAFHTELGTIEHLQSHSLRERRCEVVIGRLWRSTHADFNIEPLFHEQLFVTTSIGSKWAGRRKLTLAELLDEPWILSPVEMEPGAPVAQAFRAIGAERPRAIIWSPSLNLRNNLLATGRFITVIPGSVLRFGRQKTIFKVLGIDLPRWQLPVAIVSLSNRTLGPVAQLFIDCVRKLAKTCAEAH